MLLHATDTINSDLTRQWRASGCACQVKIVLINMIYRLR